MQIHATSSWMFKKIVEQRYQVAYQELWDDNSKKCEIHKIYKAMEETYYQEQSYSPSASIVVWFVCWGRLSTLDKLMK